MKNKEKEKLEKNELSIPKKKPFIEPELKVYEPLVDITLFTSNVNVTGGTFF